MTETLHNKPMPPAQAQPPEHVPEDLPTNTISRPLDIAIGKIGEWSSWLWIAVLLVIVTNVFSRFVMGRGSIALEELTWHFFGAAMLLSLSYAVVTDHHVRVDFLREKFSARRKAAIDLALILLLTLPVFYILTELTMTYAQRAFATMERSQSASGLPYRFIIKSMMPIGFTLLMIALASRALRCLSLLTGFPKPIWNSPQHDAPVGDSPQDHHTSSQ